MKGDFGLIAIFAIILAAVNLEAAPKQAAPTVCPSEDSLEETVLLAHESDCSKFYVCFLGEKILKECPYSNSRGDRLHFNPLLQVCDYPSEVGCKFQPVLTTYVDVPLTNQQTSQLTTPRNIPSSISSSNPSNSIRYEAHECRCNLYYENINGKKILNKCSNDRCWNQDLQTCYIDEKKESKQQGISTTKPTLPFKLTCTEGELRKHECQCQIYYQCINGDLERKSCKEDDHWDDVNKKCTRPGKAKCTYVKCPNGYYKPDEVDCDKYYTCVGQQYVPHTCASGLVWDREDERCSKTATCPINHCDQGYYKPHEKECDKYYVCYHNDYVQQTCPSGLHWDRNHKICTTPDKANCPYCIEGTTKPHELFCEWYYTCKNGGYTKQECSIGEQWDRTNHRCRRIEDANCPLNHCDQGYYKPHEKECDKYYVCYHNDYVEQTCPNKLHWDRKHNVCNKPEEANCPYCTAGSTKPHELYCEWYYTCKNGGYIKQECSIGEQWDRTNHRCRRIEDANCPLNHCDQGYYKPHEKECDKYYVCYHNDYVQQTCPSGLHWDRNHKICTTPDKANCPYCIEGTTKPHELYCEWYYTCKNGGYIKQECSIGEQWDRTNHRCRRIEDANCPLNHCDQGYYKPHEKECDKYYVCYHNDYVQQTCPSGLHWDRNHKICTTPDKANCPYCIEGTTKPHELYCEWYYTCKNGGYIKQECSIGEQWDRTNHRCRRIEDANCPLNHCDQGYYKPHEKECDKYYVCYHNDYVQQTCPSGLHWDRNHKICTTPDKANCPYCIEGTTKPHELYCEWYYTCKNGGYIKQECSIGEQWDRNNHSCRRIEDANCPLNHCDQGYYKPHEKECDKYYVCYHNDYVQQTCPSGLHWDRNHKICTTPDKANCPYCTEGSTKPHELYCEWYYTCKNGGYIKQECSIGEQWDRTNHRCRRIEDANCPLNHCDQGYYKPHEKECDKYYVCYHNDYVQQTCPSGLHWDRNHKICTTPDKANCPYCIEGTTKPHELYCEWYYTCKNGGYIKQECSIGEQWDRTNHSCRRIEDANCPLNHCDQSYYKPHEKECDKYYVCYHNDYVQQTCPSGLHWDRNHKICTTPDKANCPYCIEGSTKPHECYCELYYKCKNGGYIEQECSIGEQWDRNNYRCRKIEEANCPLNHCDQGSHKPHEKECDKYYVCYHNNYIQQTCPSGLHWDRNHKICTTPDKANCPYCTEGSTKPHELYCEWYYTCKNGGYIKQECSIGEQWDRTNHRCRRIEDANCPLNHCDQGYYKPHEKECDKYYVCYHNDYVQQTCPSGLHWDRNHKICTTPEEANCRICVDGSTKPHECQCEWSYKCISGAWNLEKCLKGFHWDRNNYRCSRPEEAHCPSYKCTEGPFKPYENVCNMYYECENNNYVPRTCKSGLHWNQARNQCTSVEEANCPYLPKVRCVEDSTLYHECKCELYYQCVKGELIQRKCPDGKEWDRKNNKCEIAEVAKCPYHPSTCKEGSFKSNELECNKYYVCENGTYVQKICPSGLYWDRKHNICSFPELVDCSVCVENSTAPHECNCNLYYLCRNGKFTKQKCDGKLEWDRVNRQCRDPSEANCHKNFVCVEGSYNYVTKACDPGLYWNQEYNLCMKPLDALYSTALITTCAEGLFKPHEKDCDKVYMCINHMYIQLKCSSGFYWNQERLYCTAPSEANCRHRSCVEASTQADNFYCEFYYVCVDGMLIQHKCPNGLHWDPIHNICTTPDKANCPSIQSSQARQEHPFGIKT